MSHQATGYVSQLKCAAGSHRVGCGWYRAQRLADCECGLAITRSEKLVLYVLADRHNVDERCAWPAVERLADEALMSLREVQMVLRDLERKGVLYCARPGQDGRPSGRGYGISYYFLQLDPDPRLQHTLNHVNCAACRDAQEKGAESAPFKPRRVHEGCKKQPRRVHEGCKNGTRNKEEHKNLLTVELGSAPPAAETEPASDLAPDLRHAGIREHIQKRHAHYHTMPVALVPWDGREGRALAKLLAEKPELTVEQAIQCVDNYYASDTDTAARPARWLPNLLEFWGAAGVKNQFGTPKNRDVREIRSGEASVGWRGS